MRQARVVRLWGPLALSWLLMGIELPLVTAVIARLPDPEVNLAAYGSLVFPLALMFEAPIIMLLAASTALSGDWDSYRKVRRFMLISSAILTGLHAAVAFTPLYDLVARHVIGAPEAVIGPGRAGLQLLLPWTSSIAYRRFQQGVLIRFERSRPVTLGTLVRLAANALVLLVGVAHGGFSGITLAASAVSCGVMAEAAFIGWSVRPILDEHVRNAPAPGQPLTRSRFLRFYFPLALTPLLTLAVQPIGAAAISRMPQAMASLAAWPGVHGLVFLTRSAPLAFHEVVVALLGEPGGPRALQRFTWILTGVVVALLLVLAATPLGALWFGAVCGLEPHLVELSSSALVLALLMPGITCLQSWYTGILVHHGRTRAIPLGVALFLAGSLAGLLAGIRWQPGPGIFFALASFTLGGLLQTAWLWRHSRHWIRQARAGLEPRPL